jgi:cell division septation protein DedD
MDPGLKQRLIGAAVLIALAVIFLPMLVQGPAPDSGVSDLSMQMPAAPEGGYVTRDLPLVAPAGGGTGGLLRDDGAELATVDTATAPAAGDVRPGAPDASAPPAGAEPVAAGPAAEAEPGAEAEPAVPAATPAPRLPATVAGGDHAVSFGAYASRASADVVISRLRAVKLPAYRDEAVVAGKQAWRVLIGPYGSRADAEAARLAAGRAAGDVQARVLALDAQAPPAAAPVATAPAPVPAPTPVSNPAPTPASSPAAAPAAAGAGFAVQLGAFSKAADAEALRERLRAGGVTAFTESVRTDKGTLTRVKAGPVLSRADAERLRAQVSARFGIDGLVRTHP